MQIPFDTYLQYINREKIPPHAPVNTSRLGYTFNIESFLDAYYQRDELIQRGMYAVIDQNWTYQLAEWIGKRRCLEIMAGAGWLSKALHEQGISIRASDDFSGDERHPKIKRVFPVMKQSALEAVKGHTYDVLIVSWPYGDSTLAEACKEWGSNLPIVYIGEGSGGCCASDSFWDNFEEIDNLPDFELYSWPGIHDFVTIGYFKG